MTHRQANHYLCATCERQWVIMSDTIGGPEPCRRCGGSTRPFRMVDDRDCECAACTSYEASTRYTGWDRIHDSNKAEGRPIGNQWPHRGRAR